MCVTIYILYKPSESRGGHTRLDHEGYSNHWGNFNSTVNKAGDGMAVGEMANPVLPDDLKALFDEGELASYGKA